MPAGFSKIFFFMPQASAETRLLQSPNKLLMLREQHKCCHKDKQGYYMTHDNFLLCLQAVTEDLLKYLEFAELDQRSHPQATYRELFDNNAQFIYGIIARFAATKNLQRMIDELNRLDIKTRSFFAYTLTELVCSVYQAV